VTRRAFLAIAAVAPVASSASAQSREAVPPSVSAPSARRAPFVTSDVARLRRVMVHEPSPSEYPISADDRALVPESWWVTAPKMAEQHRELQRLLRASGTEVLTLETLLDSAIEVAKSRGVFAVWLRALYPALAARPETVSARTLLGLDPVVRYQISPDATYRHIADGSRSLMFSRDATVMTPRGLVIAHLSNTARAEEPALSRLLADFAPAFRDYPVVFDAAQEGLFVEGGDIQVVDERTLLVGVGNRTDPRVAPLLARRLEMDVVAVAMRRIEVLKGWSPVDRLRAVLLHLDSVFTHVGDRLALALPWFLEARHTGKDPLTAFVKGMGTRPQFADADVAAAVSYLADVGRVRVYRAGSGEEDLSVKDLKLVDYVRQRGYEVVYVGGPPPEAPDFEYLIEVVLREHALQAANVVATEPRRVIAYEGATRTHAALAAAGVHVSTFDARELWPWNGGPHCLTLPLERG
jgi:arginine deiminase